MSIACAVIVSELCARIDTSNAMRQNQMIGMLWYSLSHRDTPDNYPQQRWGALLLNPHILPERFYLQPVPLQFLFRAWVREKRSSQIIRKA
jgi:hypothetical protein